MTALVRAFSTELAACSSAFAAQRTPFTAPNPAAGQRPRRAGSGFCVRSSSLGDGASWDQTREDEYFCPHDLQWVKKSKITRTTSTSSVGSKQQAQRPAASAETWDIPEPSTQQQWAPAALPPATEGYHPLEFYPTDRLELDWSVLGDAQLRTAWGAGAEAPGPAAAGRTFVILFGVGQADTEGIYSLRAASKDEGLPVDTIVAFENQDDADRYATLLEATMEYEPTVWPIEWGELLDFCNTSGYRCRLEPAGSLLIPPEYNVGMTDWEKSLRLRRGEYRVLENEPALRTAGQGFFIDGPDWIFEEQAKMALEGAVGAFDGTYAAAEQPAEQPNIIDSTLADPAELAAVKAKLEQLLPQD